ncbi:hypothetical protein DFH06DRAFT_406000 [Mycena polygramma]|nr:hypothetical protein DFH06DRAFT_406000 [Mycena polygramma]
MPPIRSRSLPSTLKIARRLPSSPRRRAPSRPSRRRTGQRTAVAGDVRGPPVRRGNCQDVLTAGCRPSDPLRPSTGLLHTFVLLIQPSAHLPSNSRRTGTQNDVAKAKEDAHNTVTTRFGWHIFKPQGGSKPRFGSGQLTRRQTSGLCQEYGQD